MSSEENTTPVPAPESWTNMKPKWQDLEQQMADHDPFDPDVMAEEPNY